MAEASWGPSPVSHILCNVSVKPPQPCSSEEENSISQGEKRPEACPAVRSIHFQV